MSETTDMLRRVIEAINKQDKGSPSYPPNQYVAPVPKSPIKDRRVK